MYRILYNPKCGGGKNAAEVLRADYPDALYTDITQITDYTAFLAECSPEDALILCGGDGTLNRFANDTKHLTIPQDIFLYAVGSGNDFARDLEKSKNDPPQYRINAYLQNLPTVSVNDTEQLFINGIGYGIDGYCCEMGDQQRLKNATTGSTKPINYTSIAIKGLIFDYAPTNAVVTVDGVRHEYQNVWLAPTMNGRFYGGGMIPTPMQDRREKQLTLMLMHCKSKLRALAIFPSLFKGEHLRYRDVVAVHRGKEITVEFDRPTPLQIDGETILDVTHYTAKAAQ